MNASEKNALIVKQNKGLSAIYKRKIAQELASVSLTQEKKDNINALVTEALDNMMPLERVEQTQVEDNDVVCKLLLKGRPIDLFRAVEPIIKSLTVYTKNGAVDTANTPEYVLTMMVEKVKKD
jgi:hypothetical protein